MNSVNINDFANSVVDMMKTYTDDVEEAISEQVTKIGDEGVAKLKNIAMPQATESGTAQPMKRRTWKEYSKSWQNTKESKVNYSSSTIHNKKHYQLTHLLEFGHATRDGKRTRAFAHVKPLSDELEKRLLTDVKEIIKKGGKI